MLYVPCCVNNWDQCIYNFILYTWCEYALAMWFSTPEMLAQCYVPDDLHTYVYYADYPT